MPNKGVIIMNALDVIGQTDLHSKSEVVLWIAGGGNG